MIDGLEQMGPNTQAVHAGERAPAPDFHPVTTPIYPAVAYHYDHTEDLDAIFGGTRQGPVYQRYGSPTVTAFERAMALLEGGEAALAFGRQPGEDLRRLGDLATTHQPANPAAARRRKTRKFSKSMGF